MESVYAWFFCGFTLQVICVVHLYWTRMEWVLQPSQERWFLIWPWKKQAFLNNSLPSTQSKTQMYTWHSSGYVFYSKIHKLQTLSLPPSPSFYSSLSGMATTSVRTPISSATTRTWSAACSSACVITVARRTHIPLNAVASPSLPYETWPPATTATSPITRL